MLTSFIFSFYLVKYISLAGGKLYLLSKNETCYQPALIDDWTHSILIPIYVRSNIIFWYFGLDHVLKWIATAKVDWRLSKVKCKIKIFSLSAVKPLYYYMILWVLKSKKHTYLWKIGPVLAVKKWQVCTYMNDIIGTF